MNAEEFYAYCVKHGACKDGLKAIEGLSFDQFWETTERGDWMLWLQLRGLWWMTPEIYAAYWAQIKPIFDAFREQIKPLDDAFREQIKPLFDAFRAQLADVLRSVVGTPLLAQGK